MRANADTKSNAWATLGSFFRNNPLHQWRMLAIVPLILATLSACLLLQHGVIPEDLCIVQADNSYYPKLAGEPATLEQLQWLPDGGGLLLKTATGGLYNIQLLPGGGVDLHDTELEAQEFSIAPDAQIVALTQNLGSDLFETDLYTIPDLTFIESLPGFVSGAISPDGRLLAGTNGDSDEYWIEILDRTNLASGPANLMDINGRRTYGLAGNWSSQKD